jgi:hypothetical protein
MPTSAKTVGLGLKLPAQVAVGQTILGRSSARNAVSDGGKIKQDALYVRLCKRELHMKMIVRRDGI